MDKKMKYLIILFVLASNWVSSQNFDALDKLLNDEFKSTEPGGVVLIKKDQDIIFQKAIGVEDMETKVPISEHTIFNTGSISKTFVAYGILILENEGKLSKEDPITNYFPDFQNKDLASKIKVKHLLSHTSGMPDLRKVSENPEFYLSAKDKENFLPIKGLQELNFEPGSKFQYSNPAFNGLALIIEKVSGEPWQDYIKKKIFEPAGMRHSKITNGDHPHSEVAHAYDRKNEGFEENDYGEFPTFAAAGNGGVWCSILDLVKYEEAIRAAQFLGEEAMATSREIYNPLNWDSDTSPQLGFSWFISLPEENEYGVKLISHTGSQGGFRAFHFSIPEKELTFIGLFNRPPTNMNNIIRAGLQLLKSNNWQG